MNALAKGFAGYARMPVQHVIKQRIKNTDAMFRFRVPRCATPIPGSCGKNLIQNLPGLLV